MGRNSQLTRFGIVGGALGTVAVAALVASCGGGGDSNDSGQPDAPQATIDAAGVNAAVADFSGTVAICRTPAGLTSPGTPLVTQAIGLLSQKRLVRLGLAPNMRAQALGSTKPADTLGTCGGRYGYTSYAHDSGVTTATLTFDNYCTSDSSTGNNQVVNGAVSFVNTATPTASGPITTKWAGSSSGLTIVSKTTAGATVSSQTMGFENLSYVVGVPGGNPTAANPDKMTATELKLVNNTTGKTYRQTNYDITVFDTATGGQQTSMSGRGYRSSGAYFDITTPTPMVMDADGNYVGGTISFAGANGSSAVATLVPGAKLQATLVVNGKPVDTAPACSK